MDGGLALVTRRRWAQEQFGSAVLGDIRRTRRLVSLATQMAGNSSGSIPQQTGAVADMKAAYRLFSADDVTHEAICRTHFAQTRERAGQLPLVFLLQDTTELNYTLHVPARVWGRSVTAAGCAACINRTCWRWIRPHGVRSD